MIKEHHDACRLARGRQPYHACHLQSGTLIAWFYSPRRIQPILQLTPPPRFGYVTSGLLCKRRQWRLFLFTRHGAFSHMHVCMYGCWKCRERTAAGIRKRVLFNLWLGDRPRPDHNITTAILWRRNGFRVLYMRKRGEDWNESEQSQKRGFCGHGDESLDSVEIGNILKTWATWKCLKQNRMSNSKANLHLHCS